jgi:hypothetical protein
VRRSYLSRSAFQDGLKKLALRFKLPKAELLEAYYQYLRPRFSDEQFIETCGVLFAQSRRFPIPHDFVESAVPREGFVRDDRFDEIDNPFVPHVITVRKGTQAYRKWQTIFEARDKAGITETRPQRYIDAGFAAPVVRFVD